MAQDAGFLERESNGNLKFTAVAPGTTDVGAEIDGAPEQTTLADTDRYALTDAGVLKWVSWANIKSTLTALFDTLYAAIGHNHDGVYSLVSHLHDDRYSLLAHNHAHNSLTGLTTGDAHTQYALLAGRSGGQTLRGGTASGNNLTLESTSHAAKGDVVLNPNGGFVGIGTGSPGGALDAGGWDGRPSPISDHSNIANDLFAGNTGANVGRLRLASNNSGGFMQWNRYFLGAGLGSGQMDTSRPSWVVNLSGQSDQFNVQRSPAGSTTLATLFALLGSGNVGIGTDSPQTRFHVALEAGGGHAVRSVSGVAGTAVVLLPAGSVTGKLQVSGVVTASDGSSSSFSTGNPTATDTILTPGSETTIYRDVSPTPAHTVALRVTAGGAVDVRRTLGNRSYTVAISLTWV